MNPAEIVEAAAHTQPDWIARQPGERAETLRAIASALEQSRALVIATASSETALTDAELAPEFSRMTRTLEMFASLVEEGSWVRAAISPPEVNPPDAIGPNHDVRSMLIPLRGAVIVFGASNFPLAYGVCGGDTASALAAGCPVVVKEHPAHRNTGRLIASIARDAIKSAGSDPDVLCYVEDDGKDTTTLARLLVEHPSAAAVGFTGSTTVGNSLIKIANARPVPIPVFAEMGSVNPNIIFPGVLASRSNAIIDQIAASIAQRHGQQCTCPGVIFLHGCSDGIPFARILADKLAAIPRRRMLSASVASNFAKEVATIRAARDVELISSSAPQPTGDAAPCVLYCPGSEALAQSQVVLDTEMFGPGVIVVDDAGSDGDFMQFDGSLTISIWFDSTDEPAVRRFLEIGRFGAGRIVFNGVPTGVRVAEGMTHGGPSPATNRSDTTAVGPRAIERWCRPVCFQNCPTELLPPALRS